MEKEEEEAYLKDERNKNKSYKAKRNLIQKNDIK